MWRPMFDLLTLAGLQGWAGTRLPATASEAALWPACAAVVVGVPALGPRLRACGGILLAARAQVAHVYRSRDP